MSATADRDYHNILLFSELRWGRGQRTAYRSLIQNALRTIREHPDIGKSRSDLVNGMRSFAAQEHVIFYRIGDATIEVARILHSRQRAKEVNWEHTDDY